MWDYVSVELGWGMGCSLEKVEGSEQRDKWIYQTNRQSLQSDIFAE